jgi:aarF domain-containing kinase
MILDYSWVLRGSRPDETSVERAHERNANRLRNLFFVNKGIYIKLGQYIGMMDHIVPESYVKALAGCFDQAPTSSFEDVEAVLKEEFGKSSSELFASFERKPVASASLAQVHVAYSHTGEKLAIKIQHRHLAQVPSEIQAIDLILRCVRYARPDFGFKQIIEEAKVNIPNELDFTLEARNSNLCRDIVQPFGSSVVVPLVYPDLVSRRVLGMKFEEGMHLCDAGALQSLGINTHTVVRMLTEVFCHMTFRHGIVHCDPHPANVLVRKDASGSVQLVLLDHGLYRFVSARTRLIYGRLWKGIVLGDVKEVERASTDLGLVSPWMEKKHPGMTHTLIAAMLTGQEWTSIASEGGLGRMDGHSEQSAKANLAKNVQEYFEGIRDVLDSCPRDLLLLLKTSDALRCCSNRLGGRTSDIFAITAKSCISALLDEEAPVTFTGMTGVKKTWWSLHNIPHSLSLMGAYVRVVMFMWWQDWAPQAFKVA